VSNDTPHHKKAADGHMKAKSICLTREGISMDNEFGQGVQPPFLPPYDRAAFGFVPDGPTP
jgi:hypothetical protein